MSELTWAQLWRAAASNLGAAVTSLLPGGSFLPGRSCGESSARQQLLSAHVHLALHFAHALHAAATRLHAAILAQLVAACAPFIASLLFFSPAQNIGC